MVKSMLLWSVALILVGGVALAEPVATAPTVTAVQQAQPAPALAQVCKAQGTQEVAAFLKPRPKLVPICQGNGCSTTSDCRPANLPECASCFCLGPAGDKSCGCF